MNQLHSFTGPHARQQLHRALVRERVGKPYMPRNLNPHRGGGGNGTPHAPDPHAPRPPAAVPGMATGPDAAMYNTPPGSILTGSALQQLVQSIVHSQVAPQLRELNRQRGTTRRQADYLSGLAGDAYRQLGNATAQSGRVLRNSLAQGNQQMTDTAAATQQALGQAGALNAQYQQQDANVRGEGLASIGQGVATNALAQQAAMAARNAQDSQNFQGGIGTAWQGLTGAIGATGALQGAETRGGIARTAQAQLAEIAGKRRDVVTAGAGLAAQTSQQIRQQEFSNYAVQKGLDFKSQDLANALQLGLDQGKTDRAKIKADAITDTLKLQHDSRKINIARDVANWAHIDRTIAETGRNTRALLSEAGKGNGKPLTHAQRQAINERNVGIRGAISNIANSVIPSAQAAKDKKTGKDVFANVGQIRANLYAHLSKYVQGAKAKAYNDLILNAAFQLHDAGYISTTSEKQLKRLGIKVPAAWTSGRARGGGVGSIADGAIGAASGVATAGSRAAAGS